jgi:GNAT superfamily N-acetyltransferase
MDIKAVDLTTIHSDKEGVPFEVRECRPGDQPDLRRFYEAFEPKRAAQGLPPADAERIDGWLRSVLPTGHHLLAFRHGELIGHALVMPTRRDGVGEYAVFLREDVRGRGVGTEFTRAVIEASRQYGLAGLWLTVEPSNRAAIRSYENAGFHFVPETMYSLEAEMEVMF